MDDIDLDRSTVGAFLSRLWACVLRMSGPVWTIARRRPGDAIAAIFCIVATGAIVLNALILQNAPHPAPMMAGKPRPIALPEATGTVVAVPRPRPAGAEMARPAGDIAKPAEVARPPAPARPQSMAELTRPAVETARPEATKPEAAKPEAAKPEAGRQRQQVITDIQRELSRRGFFDGPTDGVYGPKTDAAIRDFEHAAKLKPSAQADEALLRVIMRTSIQAVAATRAEPVPRADPARSEPPPRPPAAIRTAAAAKTQVSAGRVVAVQRALADYGYGQLTPNGMLGPETKAAIERFERERKLPVTGQISDRLTRELASVTGRPLE